LKDCLISHKNFKQIQLAMLEYDFVIQYKKGINMPADFLSRSKIDEIAAIDPFTPTLAQEQAQDPDIIKLKCFHDKAFWPR
jgi:regulator of sirC expression with transglutaminase-like and TPR domain